MKVPLMRSRVHVVVLAWATLVAPSCGENPTDDVDDPACLTMLRSFENLDAIEWLKRPGLDKHTGGMNPDAVLALALKLQELGASRVIMFGTGQGGAPPTSPKIPDGMVVELPADARQRLAIFRLYAKHQRSLDFGVRDDIGQKFLFFRWPPQAAP